MKLVETINNQKRMLETENDELKQRLNEMMNEKNSNLTTALDQAIATSNAQNDSRPGIPRLNFGSNGSSMGLWSEPKYYEINIKDESKGGSVW